MKAIDVIICLTTLIIGEFLICLIAFLIIKFNLGNEYLFLPIFIGCFGVPPIVLAYNEQIVTFVKKKLNIK